MNSFARIASPAHLIGLQKIIQAVTGLVTAFLITLYLSPEEQGYYYTMGSLLSCYILFDAGLSSVLIQMSARLSHGLHFDPQRGIEPTGPSAFRFLSLVRWTLQWYVRVGFGSLVLLPIGFLFLHYSAAPHGTSWIGPWLLIGLSIAAYMPSIGFLALLEGIGAMREVYALRIVHYLLGAIISWVLIAWGEGLYAPAIPLLATTGVCLYWACVRYKSRVDYHRQPSLLNWHQDIWPQQRKAIHVLFFNYIFLNLPILLNFINGKVNIAGQFGLSIAIANLAGAISLSWVTAITPQLTQHTMTGRHQIANDLFKMALFKGVSIYLFGSILLLIFATTLRNQYLFSRILPAEDLLFILLVFLVFHAFNAYVIYRRAENTDNFLGATGISVIVMLGIGTYFFNSGAYEMTLTLGIGAVTAMAIGMLRK